MSCQIPGCSNPVQSQDKYGRLICAQHLQADSPKQAEQKPNKIQQPPANKKKTPAQNKGIS